MAGMTLSRMVTTLTLGSVLLLVGCASDKDSLERLRAENEELRAREAQLQAAMQDSEGRFLSVEDERARLRAENERLRGQLAERPATGQRGGTGFEGIGGTTTRMQGSDIVVDVAGDVLFASGSVTLRADARQTLDRVAQVLNSRYSGNEIRIAGHTDSDPIRRSQWKTNERLSAERALAVQEYLATRGVGLNRTHIAGFGPSKPRGTKAQSRRVEIIVLGQ